MKIMTLAVLAFVLITSSAWAVDFKTITAQSLDVFVELLPQYTALVKQYGTDMDPATSMDQATELTDKILALLTRYGIAMEDFGPFMKKITLGIAQAKMKENGLPMNMFDMMGENSQLSETEINVIVNNLARLEKVFAEQ